MTDPLGAAVGLDYGAGMYSTRFATALGEFALVWTDQGLRRLLLPGASSDEITAWFARHGAIPAEPNRMVAALLDDVEDYAQGRAVDFSRVPLDLAGVPDFHRRCYDVLLTIGRGETTTYGAMARQLGDAGLARAVGQAMGANPIPLLIPCHRVLAANNGAGGFSAPGGTATKRIMLALEGVSLGAPPGQLQFAF